MENDRYHHGNSFDYSLVLLLPRLNLSTQKADVQFKHSGLNLSRGMLNGRQSRDTFRPEGYKCTPAFYLHNFFIAVTPHHQNR